MTVTVTNKPSGLLYYRYEGVLYVLTRSRYYQGREGELDLEVVDD